MNKYDENNKKMTSNSDINNNSTNDLNIASTRPTSFQKNIGKMLKEI